MWRAVNPQTKKLRHLYGFPRFGTGSFFTTCEKVERNFSPRRPTQNPEQLLISRGISELLQCVNFTVLGCHFNAICAQLFMHNVTSDAVTPSGFSVTGRPLNGHNLETDTQKVSHLPLLLSSHWMEQSDKSAVCVLACVCVCRV